MRAESVATLGEVLITLAGETVALKPTYGATARIEKRFGGWQGALAAVSSADTEVIAFIVQQGMGSTNSNSSLLIEEVWRTGIMNLTGPVMEYLKILANGGRHVRDESEDAALEKAAEKQRQLPLTWAQYLDQIWEQATGWLGWTPDQVMAATIPQIELALKGRVEWARMTNPFGGGSRPGRPGKGGKHNAAPRMVGEGLPPEDRRREVARHMRLFAMTHNKLRGA